MRCAQEVQSTVTKVINKNGEGGWKTWLFFFYVFYFVMGLRSKWDRGSENGHYPHETRRSPAIGPQFIQHCSLIGSTPSSAWLASGFRVTPLLTHTHTRTNSLYFCYTAGSSGGENKKSRFVLACFLPLLPLSSVLSLSLSFLLLLPFQLFLVSLSLCRYLSLSSPSMRCCVAASNTQLHSVLRTYKARAITQ